MSYKIEVVICNSGLWNCPSLVVCLWSLRFSARKMRIIMAAAAAKLLQSCPTLCDPIDGSPPGSFIPGILQARLEWVAISFSILYLENAEISSRLCVLLDLNLCIDYVKV